MNVFDDRDHPALKTAIKRVPRPGTQFKRILLKYVRGHGSEQDKYAALDSHSGGYPYAVDILSAHDFKTIPDAVAYRGSTDAKKFAVVELTINVAERIVVEAEKDRYQVKENLVSNGWDVWDTECHHLMSTFFGGKALAEEFAKTMNKK